MHLQDARHDAFINASAAAKPLLGLASSLGPEYTPFVQQLLENAAKSLAEEHARRRHAASAPAPGAGPSSVRGGEPEGAGASIQAVLIRQNLPEVLLPRKGALNPWRRSGVRGLLGPRQLQPTPGRTPQRFRPSRTSRKSS